MRSSQVIAAAVKTHTDDIRHGTSLAG